MVVGSDQKFVFVLGGVVSGLGKGLTAASLAAVLVSRGLSVSMMKLDPYLNVDPGTLNPLEHGEVFVTADGAETDLDLGHYERFLNRSLSSAASVTAGRVYSSVIAAERAGSFNGATVQVVPHVTDEIKARISAGATGAQVTIVELGGTSGDIEVVAFLEAVRQFRRERGRRNVFVALLCLVPEVGPSGELKTKPTQHAVVELRARGVVPDALVVRSARPVPERVKVKLANTCDVDLSAVIACPDSSSIYAIPGKLAAEGLDGLLCDHFGLTAPPADVAVWDRLAGTALSASRRVRVGLVGKYEAGADAYLSVFEALHHAAAALDVRADIELVPAELVESDGADATLAGFDALVVPGGFGPRGVEGKVAASRFAREREVPLLGLCLGMQVMVIDYARHALGLADANSTEFDPLCAFPVVSLLEQQRDVTQLGGSMRLGDYPAVLDPGSTVAAAYGRCEVVERHRHRFEFNNLFRARFDDGRFVTSGLSPDGSLVEFVELTGQFWVGCQAHPEFTSRPLAPHPLFVACLAAALERRTR